MKNQFNKFLKLSGIGIQFGATIWLSAWLGGKLDIYFETNSNYLRMTLIAVGFILSMISLIIQLNKLNRDEN